MRLLDRKGAEGYLRRNFVKGGWVTDIIDSFDFNKPVYEQILYQGEEILQFVRNPSAFNLAPDTGEYFCLSGAAQKGLAIIGGGGGRMLKRFTVGRTISVLEGTASRQDTNWKHAIGGPGGQTQMFIPKQIVMSGLRPLF